MGPLDFEKKWYRVPTEFLQKHPSIFPGFSKGTLKKHEFYINEIKQTSEHFVQQLRCYNQSNWTYRFNKKHSSFSVKYCNVFSFFFIFSQLLSILSPAFFLPLLPFVKISLSYQGMYIYFFIFIFCFIIRRCSLLFKSIYCRLNFLNLSNYIMDLPCSAFYFRLLFNFLFLFSIRKEHNRFPSIHARNIIEKYI